MIGRGIGGGKWEKGGGGLRQYIMGAATVEGANR